MPRTKKKMRITLPDGVTARDVKRALAALRNAGDAFQGNALDMAAQIVLRREAAVLLKLAEENPPEPATTLT